MVSSSEQQTRKEAPMSTTPTPITAESLKAVTGGAADSYTDRSGTAGADTISVDTGMDKVFAGDGNDVITTGTGTDEVHAGSGSDFVHAGSGNDKVFGDAWGGRYGNDTIDGGAGSDELHGDAPGEQNSGGNDALDGGRGDNAADKAFGGGGDDSYIWAPRDGNDEFHGDAGYDTLRLHTVTLDQLQAGLSLDNPNLQMLVNSLGQVSFVDTSTNQPVTFSGSFTIGGETVRFFNIERLQIQF
jgi:Ca2+-binding RTX toxin-like protein